MSQLIGPGESILLIGDSGDGKTAQFGELAEHCYAQTKQPARLYMFDQGGAWETVKPHIDMGIIELVRWTVGMDPYEFLNAAANGMVPDGWKPNAPWTFNGKYVPHKPASLYGFEGFTSAGAACMGAIAKGAASGQHKAGEDRFVFKSGTTVVASNNRTDYNLVQIRLRDACWQSQLLPAPVVWTAAIDRAQDTGMATVLGPLLVGSAMTALAMQWFKYTFRLAAIPAPNAAPRHVLYLEDHLDAGAGMAKGLANARVPLAGADKKVPFSIEPASIIGALTAIKERNDAAKAEIARRVGLVTTK